MPFWEVEKRGRCKWFKTTEAEEGGLCEKGLLSWFEFESIMVMNDSNSNWKRQMK